MKNERMILNRELALNIAEDVAGLVAIGILLSDIDPQSQGFGLLS